MNEIKWDASNNRYTGLIGQVGCPLGQSTSELKCWHHMLAACIDRLLVRQTRFLGGLDAAMLPN